MSDSDADEEREPLEVVPAPVPIDAHDPEVAGSSCVRVFFKAGSHGDSPGGAIAEVLVIEDWDRVSIALLRRVVSGEAPDGTMYGESLHMGGQASLDIPLSRSLDGRRLLDASTGKTVARVVRESPAPLPAEALGTPFWRWS